METSTENRIPVDTEPLLRVIESRGLKIKWIAEQINVHRVVLSAYLYGRRKFPRDLAGPLAEVLGVSVDFVLACFYLT